MQLSTLKRNNDMCVAGVTKKSIVLIVLVIGALIPESFLSAQGRSWSLPIQLSPFGVNGAFPDIAADPTGQTHITWSSGDELFDIVMYTSTPDGVTWSPVNDIFAFPHNPGESYVTRPVLAIDGQGAIYLGIHGVQDKLYLAETAHDTAGIAKAWRDLQIDVSGYHVLPSPGGDDKVHVIYTSGADANVMQRALHVYYRQYDGTTSSWSDPVDISIALNMGSAKPSILIDKQNILHVVWEAGIDGDRGYVVEPVSIMYSNSNDQGSTWSRPIRIDMNADGNTLREGRNVAIGMNGAGELVVVWWSMPDNQVYFRTSRNGGQTWSTPQPIPGVWGVGDSSTTRQDTYEMVTDSSGNVHLVLVGRQAPEQSELDVMHLVWDGSTWSSPSVLATYQNSLPEWPSVSMGLGNHLQVVWHVRSVSQDTADANETFQIWYAHRVIDSPGIGPVDLPSSGYSQPQISNVEQTLTPPPTATPPRFLVVDLDPAKKQRDPSLGMPQSIRTENDEVLLLIAASIPVAILVALVLAIMGVRRTRAQNKFS